MKRIVLLGTIAVSVFGTALAQQPTGGSGSAQSAPSAQSNASAGASARDQGALPPGLQREQLPPGLDKREELPPGLARRGNLGTTNTGPAGSVPLTNAPGSTPNPVANTGERSSQVTDGNLGTIGRGVVGGANTNTLMTPTSTQTNSRLYGTNQYQWRRSATNSMSTSTTLRSDRAATEQDRTLLIQVRRQITPVISRISDVVNTTSDAWAPIHFDIRQGVVTVVGMVPTVEYQERIVETIESLPGVVRVVNQLKVQSEVSVGGAVETQESVTVTNTGTSNLGVSNSVTNSNTILSPTSNTNQNRQYGTNGGFGATNNPGLNNTNNQGLRQNEGLPPGLRKREELPPGLQNRTLPPGLNKRLDGSTNASPSKNR